MQKEFSILSGTIPLRSIAHSLLMKMRCPFLELVFSMTIFDWGFCVSYRFREARKKPGLLQQPGVMTYLTLQ